MCNSASGSNEGSVRFSLMFAHAAEAGQIADMLELCEEDCCAQSPHCGNGELTEELARREESLRWANRELTAIQ
jgi:hypothetical protein